MFGKPDLLKTSAQAALKDVKPGGDAKIGVEIIRRACESPLRQLTENAASIAGLQKREMEELIGTWDDTRTAGEIIADIENARTAGREVAL